MTLHRPEPRLSHFDRVVGRCHEGSAIQNPVQMRSGRRSGMGFRYARALLGEPGGA